jgi:hypothetical protein
LPNGGGPPDPVDDPGRFAGLVVRRVPLSDLHHDPANVRKHGDRNLQTITASLKEFGQVEPLVVQKGTGKVIGGNGRLTAMAGLNWTECDIVEVEADHVRATALGITLNRTADLAAWDDAALAETLRALQSDGVDMPSVGFTDDEVDSLIEGLGSEMLAEGEAESETPAGANVFSDEQVIEAAFRWFRAAGFPYRNLPAHVCMQEINRLAASENLAGTDLAFHVADTYHPHRFHAAAEGMLSPFAAFGEDKSLRRAMRLAVEHGYTLTDQYFTQLNIVSGTQACSNFRPGFACKIYRDYAQPGDTVLDTSTGYGGRLVGFMASGIAGQYVGIDPNTETHAGNLRMAADLGFADRVELHNLPAEDVPHEAVAGRCDFAFTSPPYFRKEHYSDEPTQSWKRYPTGDSWRDGFLLPMLRLQFAALKLGKFAVVNIADVKIKGTTYPLASWAVTMGEKAGFRFIRTDDFAGLRRFGGGHNEGFASEPVLVFQKPAD